MRADALAIRELSERVPVVAFVNNHFAGHAPQTVAELLAALDPAGEADARDTAAGSGRPRRALPGRENSRADQQIRTIPIGTDVLHAREPGPCCVPSRPPPCCRI
jgi:hypothetical protein